MMEHTITNPGCYHSALAYASELTGIAVTKEIRVDKIDGLYGMPNKNSRNPKRKLKYKSYDIIVVQPDGTRRPFFEDNERFDNRGTIADHFIVRVQRGLEEFGVEVKQCGKYKDSLGGGWHHNVPLYSIKDQFFADMDCAC